MRELYMGLENEFKVFSGKHYEWDVYDFVEKLAGDKGVRGGEVRVGYLRTLLKTGNAVYNDRSVIELLTPPIRINRGFASRLADSIFSGRDLMIDSLDGLTFSGYSMHWNLTRGHYYPNPINYWKGIAIPFLVMGINPLSVGVNIRANGIDISGGRGVICDEKKGRLEILGESLQSYEQIAATALLLGAYHIAMALGDKPLLRLITDRTKIIKEDGELWTREKHFHMATDNNECYQLKAKKVLEVIYNWLKPYIKALGTKDDSRYLKEFVEGSRKLEIDMHDYFKRFIASSRYREGIFYPGSNKGQAEHVLKHSPRRIKLPLENRLMLAIGNLPNLVSMDWDKVCSREIKVSGVDRVYSAAIELERKKRAAVRLDSSFSDIKHAYRHNKRELLGMLDE